MCAQMHSTVELCSCHMPEADCMSSPSHSGRQIRVELGCRVIIRLTGVLLGGCCVESLLQVSAVCSNKLSLESK